MQSKNRRLNQRKRVSLHVYLTSPGREARRFTARNLSIGGLFLEMERLEVPINNTFMVFIALRKPSSPVIRVHPLAARVVHWTPDGVGLKFCRRPQRIRRTTPAPTYELPRRS